MLYDELQQLVTDILSDPDIKQGTVRLIKMAAVAGPTPWKPGTPTQSITELNATVKGVDFEYVSQGLAISTDLQITFSVPAVSIDPVDFMEVNGEQYKIVQIIKLPASGTPVAMRCIVRRGS